MKISTHDIRQKDKALPVLLQLFGVQDMLIVGLVLERGCHGGSRLGSRVCVTHCSPLNLQRLSRDTTFHTRRLQDGLPTTRTS